MIVRPVRSSDLPALIELARSTGTGLTTLPANEGRLGHRVGWAEKSFHKLIYWKVADKGGHFAAWEQPIGTDEWEIPRHEVNAAVAKAFSDFEVVLFGADPPYWRDELAK